MYSQKNSEKNYLNKEEKKAKNVFYEKSQRTSVESSSGFNTPSCHHVSRYFFKVPPMRVSSSYFPSAFDHTNADQWLAAFEVHLGTTCGMGYPN